MKAKKIWIKILGVIFSLLMLGMVFASHLGPETHDRILTDEMGNIDASVGKISGLAEKGKFEDIQKEVKIIENNVDGIRAELYLRGEASAASEFERTLAGLKEAANAKDKSGSIQAGRQLGAALGNVKKVLQNLEIDAYSLVIAFGSFVIVWILLTFFAIRAVEKLGIKG